MMTLTYMSLLIIVIMTILNVLHRRFCEKRRRKDLQLKLREDIQKNPLWYPFNIYRDYDLDTEVPHICMQRMGGPVVVKPGAKDCVVGIFGEEDEVVGNKKKKSGKFPKMKLYGGGAEPIVRVDENGEIPPITVDGDDTILDLSDLLNPFQLYINPST